MHDDLPRKTSAPTQGRLKLAELSSALGAGVLGLGAGVLIANPLRGLGLPLLVVGLALHAWGMTDKHRIEASDQTARIWWSTALYWICWLGLAAVAAYALVRLL